MPRILALDLATNTGFACGSFEEAVVESGSFRLPKTGEDVGLFLAHFRKWFGDAVRRLDAKEIIFEEPVLPDRGKTTLITLRKLYSLSGLTELLARDLDVKCEEANPSDVLTHFCGKTAPRIGDARKKAVVAKCIERGWKPCDDDEADALAVLDYAFALRRPAHALEATPLFGGQP